jgi:hypothetical protein
MLIHATLPGQNLKKKSKKQSNNLTIKNLTTQIKINPLEKYFQLDFLFSLEYEGCIILH